MKILVIDDSQKQVDKIKGLIKNYTTNEDTIDTASEQEMTEHYLGNSYDFIFLDLHLKWVSGEEIAKRIKEETPFTKVMITTGDTTNKTKELVKSLGCTYIDKFNIDEKLDEVFDF